MSTPLLSTKLSIPPLRPDLVSRPRLMAQLDEVLGPERGLALVSAPAGFGKTTLVAAWLRNLASRGDARPAVAWLSLDEGDSDPVRFLSYLVAALQSADLTIGRAAGEMLQSHRPPTSEPLLTALVNDLALAPRPLVVAVDDYHVITALPVHQQLAFLIEHRPEQLHLVIASREDPPLPLPRLRARGQMVEIRQEDLEFTEAEAARFFHCAVPRELSAADVAALHKRTEGWAAGMQLAALSIPGQVDLQQWLHDLAGSQRYILDYLMEEVFRRQPAAIQDFLLATAILDRLTGSLCDAVTERDDGEAVLAALERANLFIVPFDDSRTWYRYHHLFADVLRHRLQSERTSQIPALHRRASRWYAAHNYLPDAVRHALAASDWEAAAELILGGTAGELLERGELMTLLGWFRAFPEPILRGSPRLCCEYAWPLMLTGQTEAAASYLDQAERAPQVRSARAEPDGLASATASASYDAPLGLLPPDRLPERALILLNLGMARWYEGRLPEAQEMLSEAQRAGRTSGDSYAWLTASIHLNKIQIARGNLRRGAALHEELIGHRPQLPIAALAYYDLGALDYEWNELDAAAAHTTEGIRLSAQSGGCDELLAAGYAGLALIRQAQGQAAEAREASELAAEKLSGSTCSPAGHLYCLAASITVALARGDLGAAAAAAGEIPTLADAHAFPDDVLLRRAQARLQLALGEREVAAGHLAQLHEVALGMGWQHCATQVRALQSLAAPSAGQALDLLAEALAASEPEGLVRTYLDLGEPIAALLQQALARDIAPAYVRRLLRAFAAVDEPRRVMAVLPPGLLEVLTQRELEVLRLLAGGLSNQEIAIRLCVSDNTVKTHLANIYGKLGASGRREAVARARSAGLLA